MNIVGDSTVELSDMCDQPELYLKKSSEGVLRIVKNSLPLFALMNIKEYQHLNRHNERESFRIDQAPEDFMQIIEDEYNKTITS